MNAPQNFLILSSPPGSGKTYWINGFSKAVSESEILIISPLRALADECRDTLGKGVIVETPESWLVEKKMSKIVVFDEFHLLTYWGESFRPVMWEVFYELSQHAELMIGLTATISDPLKEVIGLFSNHFDQVIWCDHGNQKFKNIPTSYFKISTKKMMEDFILTERPMNGGVSLVFCPYRQEVFRMAHLLEKKGFVVWTCVGGESVEFSSKVRSEPQPDYIVSTTVLSHGVNLPKITKIYFMYQVKCLDFWIQMVARGGRKGEKFKIFALENPSQISWNRFTNALAILHLSFKMKRYHFTQQFIQWFLKE